MKPLVSIAISFYNQAPYIKETVASGLAQTFKDIEVLIRDDGSTDGGAQQLADLKDPRIRFFSGPNLGPSRSNNILLKEASGDFVAFLAGDDIFKPNKLEKQLALAKTQPQGLYYSAVDYIDEHSQPIPIPKKFAHLFNSGPPDKISFFRKLFFEGNFIHACSILAPRKNILAHRCLRPSLLQLQDYALWMSLASELEPIYSPEPLVQYRVLSGGKNLGAPTPMAERRKGFEEGLLFDSLLNDLPSERFENLFQSELKSCKYKDPKLRHAVVLLTHSSPGARLKGLEKMSHHLDSKEDSEISIWDLNSAITAQKLFIDERHLHSIEKVSMVFFENLKVLRRILEF